MTEDEVAERVEVAASWRERGRMRIEVAVVLPDGTAEDYQFDDALRAA